MNFPSPFLAFAALIHISQSFGFSKTDTIWYTSLKPSSESAVDVDIVPVRGNPSDNTFMGTVRIAFDLSIDVRFHDAGAVVPRRMGVSFSPSWVVIALSYLVWVEIDPRV